MRCRGARVCSRSAHFAVLQTNFRPFCPVLSLPSWHSDVCFNLQLKCGRRCALKSGVCIQRASTTPAAPFDTPIAMFLLTRSVLRIGHGHAFTSNLNVTRPLQSSFFPRFPSLFRNSKAVSQVRSYRHSDTWARYNKHYGRNKINWRTLRNPAIFTVSFCAGTTLAVPYLFQIPPFSVFKRNPNALVFTLIGLNVAGFLAWKSPVGSRYMARYGLLVKDNVASVFSLLGSAFSHQEGMHLLFNMLMLYSFGSTLCGYVGASNFLTMYLNSAVLSSFVSLALPIVTRSSMLIASLGASGAIFSVFGAFSYLFPRSAIAFFFLPIPGGAWFAFLGTMAFNVAGLFMKWGRYDYAAHLGGCLAGIGYGWWFDKKRSQRRKVYMR